MTFAGRIPARFLVPLLVLLLAPGPITSQPVDPARPADAGDGGATRDPDTVADPDTVVDPGAADRPRARDLGVRPGIFPPGSANAITDVEGVRVGHATRIEGDDVRTGVTAVLPHPGDLFHERVPAAIHVANGYGKLIGETQVRELGEIETPILLTCTLCVWKAADALVAWMLARPGMEEVGSLNPVVGETNDGVLNDIRARPIDAADVRRALEGASSGAVEEGSVGAGTGTRAYGWKGGIGTSSRILPDRLGGYRVGVLVQTNHGGVLTIAGAPVGRELGRYSFREAVGEDGPGAAPGTDSADHEQDAADDDSGDAGDDAAGGGPTDGVDGDPDGGGSIMIVVATDAPLSSRNLGRLARRAVLGLARTGSFVANGSGDYVVAFSTAETVRRRSGERVRTVDDLANREISALFQGVVEATEEAIYNSLFRATTVTGAGGRTVEALPIEETRAILRRYGAVE